MKKIVSVVLVVLMVFGLSLNAFAHPNNLSEYIFVVNNDEAMMFGAERPFTIDGYTFVADYIIRDRLAVAMWWNDSKKTLYMTRGDLGVAASLKENILYTPKGNLSIKFHVINNVMMVPLEPIAEALGFGSTYIPEGRIVRITNGDEKLTNTQVYEKYIGRINEEKKNFTAYVPAGKKVVYLTFDDGPDRKNTPQILDILKKYNAKATFFMLEGNMKSNPDIVKRIKAEGHTVGLHGVTHSHSKFYGTQWAPANEMQQANTTLKNIIGEGTPFCRVPYGSAPNLTNQQYSNLKNSGFIMWDWNIDSQDSLAANVSSQKIYNNSVAGLSGKTNPVMLFHDRTNVVYCLDSLLSYLTKNGYYAAPITQGVKAYNWKER